MYGIILILTLSYARQYTISGFSSGGFFAHQMHIALSQNITGVGIVAGGPYYCTLGSYNRFQTACKSNPYLISLPSLIQQALTASASNTIDSVGNLSNSLVYIFSGQQDTVVFPGVVRNTELFYRNFSTGGSNIQTNYEINSQHSWVTNGTGNPCWYLGPPGVNNCGFDLAGAILQHIIGGLKPPGVQNLGNLYPFSQSQYVDTWKAGMSNRGFVYIPQSCMNSVCKVHVLFHGCFGSYEINKLSFMQEIGVNEWAESNNIVVIYPQISAQDNNDEGCWDFWGYTGEDFMLRSALQINAANLMANNPPIVKWSE